MICPSCKKDVGYVVVSPDKNLDKNADRINSECPECSADIIIGLSEYAKGITRGKEIALELINKWLD